jgi:putative Mg2+ transporter-C (MgtC) family protein
MIPWWEISLRLLFAAVLGGMIGWERESRHKPAGLRTLMLVSVAAAMFMLTVDSLGAGALGPGDHTRVIAAVAQGIGFLGAGAILQGGGEVRWLTTAASIWAAAGLGVSAGLGAYYLAALGGVLVFAILHWGVCVEDRWIHRAKSADREEGPTGRGGTHSGV